MPRVTIKLNDTQIKNAKPRLKEYNLADGKGLSLRILPNGAKYWLFNYYRPYSKKRSNLCYGRYPDISLAEARTKRDEYIKLLKQNIDPKEHKHEQALLKQEELQNTLKLVAAQWLEVKKTQVSLDHANDTWRSLELHIFPDLGNVPIHKIKAKTTIDIIQPLAKKGSLETVKRLCQRLNEVMVFALNSGIIDNNPLSGIYKAFGSPDKKHMPTIRPDQLPKLMKAITEASIRITTRNLIKWQLHTMVRPSEASGTRWEEIDLENKCWIIPAERMKKKREHIVPLSEQTIEILENMKPISSHREFVFPSDREPKKHANSSTANVALKRMGYGGILVAHGMRALASTVLNEHGFDPDVIEAALAHIEKNEVRRAYNRAEYLERRKVMMCWWSDYIKVAESGRFHKNNKHLKVMS